MSDSETYEITIYLGWRGSEGTWRFKSREQYERARNFLDKLTGMRSRRTEVPPEAAVGNYYYIAKEEREAFERFMKTI